MPRRQTESLVTYFRSFLLFLLPIKIEPVSELSGVDRQACAVSGEDSKEVIGKHALSNHRNRHRLL